MATQFVANTQDIARYVTNALEERAASKDQASTLTVNQVEAVYKCIGKFIDFMFKKKHYDCVIAEIANFGTVLRNNTTDIAEFIPASQLQIETHISKPMLSKIPEPYSRQELIFSKISSVTQLSESLIQLIMQHTVKAIGHFLRKEQQTVVCDFGLSTNEAILFKGTTAEFVELRKVRNLINSEGVTFGDEGRRTQRFSLANTALSNQFDTKTTYSDFDDMKSVARTQAARNLSLALQREQKQENIKIQKPKLQEDSVFSPKQTTAQTLSALNNDGSVKYGAIVDFLRPRATLASSQTVRKIKSFQDSKNTMTTAKSNLEISPNKEVKNSPRKQFQKYNKSARNSKSISNRAKRATAENTQTSVLPSPFDKEMHTPKVSLHDSSNMSIQNQTSSMSVGRSFQFPNRNGSRLVHPEVESLMSATAQMSCLKPGSSNLGQAIFKTIKNSNQLNLVKNQAEQMTEERYQRLKDEMISRKHLQEQQLAEYKLKMIRAKETKKRVQHENGDYWKKQMDFTQSKLDEEKREQKTFDPETSWCLEGPTRKRTEATMRKTWRDGCDKTNHAINDGHSQKYKQEKVWDLNLGKKMIEHDLESEDLDRQLLEFKRQTFAQDMVSTWEKQLNFKNKMRALESER